MGIGSSMGRVLSVDPLVSLWSFVCGCTSFLFLLHIDVSSSVLNCIFRSLFLQSCLLMPALLFVVFNINKFVSGVHQCSVFGNFWRAYLLGCVFGLGSFFALESAMMKIQSEFCIFGIYLDFLAFFHWSEFYFTSIYNLSNCSLDIYMLTHSSEYLLALTASVLEYWLKHYLSYDVFSSYRWSSTVFNCLGFGMCIFGEVLRKLALLTAGGNFNHYVQFEKNRKHQLVTSGVYSWFRHPAYVGWFCWCIGTQVLLINPLCLVAYTVVTFIFFKRRIYAEEKALVDFFGENYRKYQKLVSTGIPFIHGYVSH
ncbi:protein-s-isoprenylcysteine o-methyltransferase,putative (ec 2.1.1.100) (isoprenylcysteine carboxylmethyltransferase) (prenylcysteine carboxyl methyltransferase) (pccmt) (prenylated protein carboxyl methyltransferase) (ppmt) (farnesyl cysteine carboxyl methyltransferase) (fcmt) [Schistosoma mansoni]|uniref:protein-s-isoprenylcysteine o-methyltransferase,putative (ec 2.1.1.100) (isoprenylcysteine carboxylmethyltransferase) (prenylcysteine carboxyl methyltransferase) (pccmt) (prenylated protein carboxyl methyltransferase) (ppmt) (farnesyl cysteine carboxyl methyltransferase) (fcmt) n=1 Tax=Schistosoma mansoni TaxID=6183 RepID=UPI0001A62D25|nr:protein-s-isoprenylcysteine o-methyltransferase,putative (ec 2.1.1.100) (isoprenylcysteine carboxylmethyltransferase) (prenylcysteine carboxyl methyltransferase) (pccmt) (prenylated protein carboxyl methyltransferase) (ppmt) (farnesyl cysteine carboxyl methyltransferase) (fcmt) [Schistosoma mansoni]|eukprot:XP_018652228.1 protein-s-isoprenylcysteine o-methyltransferase,putative (ec 2.1.1.100) (isoprenylcysteine carboxylmethyltransferase) (prenylcysteine carboxyl methyltransferase) (pccmt) (prenylated protein carboxyl methyltransferase) (ppmt) (farnesyl cysteine carboxyl methyltransferase) (fcmt) [Schistosoma mansoni]